MFYLSLNSITSVRTLRVPKVSVRSHYSQLGLIWDWCGEWYLTRSQCGCSWIHISSEWRCIVETSFRGCKSLTCTNPVSCRSKSSVISSVRRRTSCFSIRPVCVFHTAPEELCSANNLARCSSSSRRSSHGDSGRWHFIGWICSFGSAASNIVWWLRNEALVHISQWCSFLQLSSPFNAQHFLFTQSSIVSPETKKTLYKYTHAHLSVNDFIVTKNILFHLVPQVSLVVLYKQHFTATFSLQTRCLQACAT